MHVAALPMQGMLLHIACIRVLFHDHDEAQTVCMLHCCSLMCPCARMQRETLANKAVYFVRINAKGVGERTPEADIAMGQVQDLAFRLLQHVSMPHDG